MVPELDITGIVLTYNEAPNIGRILRQLQWLPRVVVVDSKSTDDTQKIVDQFDNTDFIQRSFDNHTNQWNFGLQETNIDTEWVLALDADYYFPDDLCQEILHILKNKPNKDAFWLQFKYAIQGRVIKSGIYPPVQVLYRKDKAIYKNDGHTQRLHVEGSSGRLQHKAIHDDRKSFKRWLISQLNYAELEAEKLSISSADNINRRDRVRLKYKSTPILIFFYCILWRSGWRDGLWGWMYAYQRLLAEILLQYKLFQQKTD